MTVGVRGRIGPTGALVAAEAPLAELNARAGGAEGAPVAVPQIAAIVRLARRLRIIVSRAAVASDGDGEIDLWVRAEPADDEVALVITGWTRRERRTPLASAVAGAERDYSRASADWQWETDDKLRLTALSDAAAASIGGSTRPFIGAPLTRLFSFVPEPDGGMPVLVALAEHRRFDAQLAELRGGDGTLHRLHAIPMKDGRGGFAGFRGGAVRIGAPPDAPRAIDAPDDGAFAARLDDALRAPLGRIIANADDLQAQNEGPLRAEYAGYANDIASAGRHLLSLVDDLVDLQAIERSDFHPERDALDLAEIGRRAAGLLAVRASANRVAIDRPGADERLPATGEFRRVLQILVNLIGNAVRYSPPDMRITVRVERQGDMAAIIVSDVGKGIAPEDQTRIFEKFERVDPSEPGGTGLGLYIARRLARAMGGDLTVGSVPGDGASFTLTLPAI